MMSEAETYKKAFDLLNSIYAKTRNLILEQHELKFCKQQAGKNLNDYFQNLKRSSSDCNFRAVSATRPLKKSNRRRFCLWYDAQQNKTTTFEKSRFHSFSGI